MDIEPLGIAFAIRPGNDVRGAQQGWVGNPGKRTTALPIVHKTSAKDVLTDPLDDQPFHFGRPRQVRYLCFKLPQGCIRQDDSEFIDATESPVERAKAIEGEADTPRTWHVSGWQAQFGNDACVVQGEKPWPLPLCGAKMDLAFGRRRANGCPACLFPQNATLV